MSARKHSFSLRLTKAQQQLVRDYATARSVADYEARHRIFERGLEVVFKDEGSGQLVEVAVRLELIEALLDRTLFTAACAYVFAANAAAKGTNNMQALNQTLSAAAIEAYQRQLEIARSDR